MAPPPVFRDYDPSELSFSARSGSLVQETFECNGDRLGQPSSYTQLDLTPVEGENERASGSSKSTDMGHTNSRENKGASGSSKSSSIGRTTSRKNEGDWVFEVDRKWSHYIKFNRDFASAP